MKQHSHVTFFKEDFENIGCLTNRVAYNPILFQTPQAGDKNYADIEWLRQNLKNREMCSEN